MPGSVNTTRLSIRHPERTRKWRRKYDIQSKKQEKLVRDRNEVSGREPELTRLGIAKWPAPWLYSSLGGFPTGSRSGAFHQSESIASICRCC